MKKNWKQVVSVVLAMVALINCTACGNRFDAKGYTEALLNQYFQGDVTGMLKYDKETNSAELKQEYVDNVDLFVQNTIQGNMEMDSKTFSKYEELCKNIFSAMRYKVKEAKKTKDGAYEVTVQIQPSDVFEQFLEGIKEEQESLIKKAEKGEYNGTEEEIQQQVTEEFLNSSYGILEQACKNMSYNDKEDIVLKIEPDKDGNYAITNDSFEDLFDRILLLDVINGSQDNG